MRKKFVSIFKKYDLKIIALRGLQFIIYFSGANKSECLQKIGKI
jgi:hypothetical protein